MRQFYQGRYPAVPADRWLPTRYDNAVIGMAERHNELAPVYQFTSLLNVIPSASAELRFREAMQALMKHDRVAVMHVPAKAAFWERVRKQKMMAWELLSPAIVGVMAYGAAKAHAVVYERFKVLDMLSEAVVDSEEADPFTLAVRDYKTRILPCVAGPATPWYYYKENPDEIQ